ncbi:hypothetical protein GGS23DRAFT_411728 [Durotheca rogersii]|uniref:uncharacterized protein n=1 Tax=Durotheca rogersii TaxID=419775 RepID=UPI00221FA420|nr:uncharacterized protein GGS23DRAFT_411728 [Durotheca rogersii]KAI5865151.1 hypothetical protein GGS23DRAFT_411728 [Durotheca rogersii]
MPKKHPNRRNAPASSPSAAAAGDSRFANFESDPRFRLPSKRSHKTTIDKRFSHMLEDDEFIASAKVDRYGRKLKSDSKKKALQKIYQVEGEAAAAEQDSEEGEETGADEEDVVRRELRRADAKYDPARGGGFSSSESDSDPDQEDGEDDEVGDTEIDPSGNLRRGPEVETEIETGEVTKRIAIVNLDWDHIKSVDLMALFSSFVPKSGRIERISIYPSEFGKARIQREDLEGPPRELFKKASNSRDGRSKLDSEDDSGDDDEDDEDDEQIKKRILEEGDGQDFDSDALRAYQLDRLRYYYAVMVCSDTDTAEKIYRATDGTEYQSSSNFMDLRFVPDDVTFDDEPRDECDVLASDYKPTEFTTDALQHSKVRLTWDMHPEEVARKESMKRAFDTGRSGFEENDLRAYLASDSDGDSAREDDEAEGDEVEVADDQPKLTRKELKAKKLRDALGLGPEPLARASKSGPVGDMQITFSAALMDGNDKKTKEPDVGETTIEKYKRKERERKTRKKEKSLAKRNGDREADDEPAEPQGDLGFDDPFFTAAADEPVQKSKTSERKEERLKRREARDAQAAENAAQRAQLERLLVDDSKGAAEHLDHFDMNEIARAEKQKIKKHKKKGKKGAEEPGGLQHGFTMDVNDDRFKAVFDSHEFAIDPSNPRYEATPGMKQLLEEKRKKRKNDPDMLDVTHRQSKAPKKQRR